MSSEYSLECLYSFPLSLISSSSGFLLLRLPYSFSSFSFQHNTQTPSQLSCLLLHLSTTRLSFLFLVPPPPPPPSPAILPFTILSKLLLSSGLRHRKIFETRRRMVIGPSRVNMRVLKPRSESWEGEAKDGTGLQYSRAPPRGNDHTPLSGSSQRHDSPFLSSAWLCPALLCSYPWLNVEGRGVVKMLIIKPLIFLPPLIRGIICR